VLGFLGHPRQSGGDFGVGVFLPFGHEADYLWTRRAQDSSSAMNVIIGKDVLNLWDEYDQDFGLLDERWACEEDRRRLTPEQGKLFGEYLDSLLLMKVKVAAVQLKEEALQRINEIEKVMDPEVAEILKKRVLGCERDRYQSPQKNGV
jgi:hypothetical protein